MDGNFQVGQGISWILRPRSRFQNIGYGVVMSVNDGDMTVCAVDRLSDMVRCYDDRGADRTRDGDNVRLKDCPPPFRALCTGSRGCFADGNPANMISITADMVDKFSVRVIDGGARISQRDMGEILNHPWVDVPQKEKTVRELPYIDYGVSGTMDFER